MTDHFTWLHGQKLSICKLYRSFKKEYFQALFSACLWFQDTRVSAVAISNQ